MNKAKFEDIIREKGVRYIRDLGSKKYENIQATINSDEFDENYMYDLGYNNEPSSYRTTGC